MTANADDGSDAAALLLHGGLCRCPVCSGIGLDQIPVVEADASEPAASNPLSSLPQLSSNPTATAKLFLDFDGHVQASWGSWSNVTTRVFDQDGDATTFSNAELTTIQEVWARVAEDYAPYHIDVTTIAPGSQANGVVAHIAIGGNWSDWYGHSAGGVAYIGGFYNGAPNVGYVFEDALGNGNARYVAEAASHEAGHLFGLQHQARWDGNTLVESYNSGTSAWAPIMGVGYYAARTTWHNGATSASPGSLQDDMAILANASNGFGYRTDDHGDMIGTATELSMSGTSASASGLVGRVNDRDVFSFRTGEGSVSFQLAVATVGANLDAVLELWNGSGVSIATAAPTDSFGASLAATLEAGTYYLVARGSGVYGSVGQYTISGTIPLHVPAPEIRLAIGGSELADGGTIDFGNVAVGSPVTRTVTIVNDGDASLTLTPLDPGGLPAGFTLVANLGATVLAPGESTSFTVQFDAASAGSFGGWLSLASDDADESPFDLLLSAAAYAPTAEITLLVAGDELAAGGSVEFGATLLGYSIDRTITVRNDGDAELSLSPLDPGGMPVGFSLLANLGATTLQPGETTSFIVRLNGDIAGSFSGDIALASSDDDESPFVVGLSGTVAEPEPSLTRISDNGGTGNTRVGTWRRVSGRGYENDLHLANKGNGSIRSTWSFSALPDGEYQVWATWSKGSTYATNSPFSLYDGGVLRQTTRVSQRVGPSGLWADGAHWKSLGTVTITSGRLVVRLTNAANGLVVADAIRIERLPAVTAPAPEIHVALGGDLLSSGCHVSFGTRDIGSPQTRTFTITNHGAGSLSLTPLDPISLPAGFSLAENFATTFLTPGESTTFAITLDAAAAGSYGGEISLSSNDGDQSPFTFQIDGAVVDPSAPLIRTIDNGDAGNIRVGGWSRITTRGYESDIHIASKGNGSVRSSWTFGDLPDGEYNVLATWKIGSTYATNAPYSLYSGGQLVGSANVNQRIAPSGLWDGTTRWQSLATVSVTGGQLVVTLTNAANGTVVADAVRIERVPLSAAALESAESATAGRGAPLDWLAELLASAQRPAAPSESFAIAATTLAPTSISRRTHPGPWWLDSSQAEWPMDLDTASEAVAWPGLDEADVVAAVDALLGDLAAP